MMNSPTAKRMLTSTEPPPWRAGRDVRLNAVFDRGSVAIAGTQATTAGRRRSAAPTTPKPPTSIAQAPGSGTAAIVRV